MILLTHILPFLIVISIIVTVHELGHYLMARAFKTRMDRFSVGFGSIIWSRKDRHGTQWAISVIPLGGYVKFTGDETISSLSPDAETLETAKNSIESREGEGAHLGYYHFKPVWQRALIAIAGPVANFLLAIFIFSSMYLAFGDFRVPAVVGAVAQNSPAAKGGLLPQDTLKRIDGRAIHSFEDVKQIVFLRADTKVDFIVERAGKLVSLSIKLGHKDTQAGSSKQLFRGGVLGIEARDKEAVRQKFNVFEAIVEGNRATWAVLDTNLTYIGRIFAGLAKADQISGVIGMTQVSGEITEQVSNYDVPLEQKIWIGVMSFIRMMAVLSVGIGFLNLLPIPTLDGGHLLFYAIEAIWQKPVNANIQAIGFQIGFVALIGLMIFGAYNDLNRIGLFNWLGGLFS